MFAVLNGFYNYFYPPEKILEQIFERIPEELIKEIFSHLELNSIVVCSRVNKNWEQLNRNSIKKLIIDRPKKRYGALNKRLGDDRDVLLAMVKKRVGVLFNANKRFLNEKDFMLEAIKQDFRAIAFNECEEVRNNEELILTLIKKDYRCFECAGESLKKDRKFVSTAINTENFIFKFVNDEIRNDKQFIFENLIKTPKLIVNIPMTMLADELFYNEFLDFK